MNLVIVESPTKARTLTKFLGRDFKVAASMGHIRDLPKNELGVDVEHDFSPHYIVPPKSKKVVSNLKKEAKEAKQLFLATDPDREGEAIAWHIADVIGEIKNQKSKIKNNRVVFHEITKGAVQEAFAHPQAMNIPLVNAQQARRILDRLVGYKLSPLLWEKIRYGLSAGRVQSVAVRLIVERERERELFKPEEYWRIEAKLRKTLKDPYKPLPTITATLLKRDDKKLKIRSKDEADKTLAELKKATYTVAKVLREERFRNPPPPFMTSTLQRAASSYLGFSAKRTMRVAQNLYEQGLITYHRTDSLSLAPSAVEQIRVLVAKKFGSKYLPPSPRRYKTKSRVAQEAHEAIRPTDVKLQIPNDKLQIGRDGARLYDLIWRRTAACQMNPAVFDETVVEVEAGRHQLQAKGSVLKFDGFLCILKISSEDKVLPPLLRGELLKLLKLTPSQHFTEPPSRFSEATLIKTLEENGIGRPSTYAPIISTIQGRGYIEKEGKFLAPKDVGMVVNDLLVEHFPEIVDIKFTAKMEENLDGVARGEKRWVPMVREFYKPFAKQLEEKSKELKKEEIVILKETEEKCLECGKNLVVKLGKYGKFLSCSAFPKCKYAKPLEGEKEGEKVDEAQLEGKCPECKGELQVKEGKFGKFIACGNYPKCKFTKPYLEKIGMKCPDCGKGEVIVKRSRKGKTFFGCSRYPNCKFASWRDPHKPTTKASNRPGL